jgi:nitrogen fixation protein NifU and related proteins
VADWDDIQEHFENPYHYGKCPNATHVRHITNMTCGDSVSIELRIEYGRVKDAWFTGDGCIASLSSASMLMQELENGKIPTAQEWLSRFPMTTPKKRQCVLLPIECLAGVKL